MKVLPCLPSPRRLLLLPDWLPKPWWKRPNVRLRFCLAIQLHFLCLFLCWSVSASGWQSNVAVAERLSAVNDDVQLHQIFKRQSNGLSADEYEIEWKSCKDQSSCNKEIIGKQILNWTLCYPSALGKQGAQKFSAKASRRFKLTQQNDALPELLCSDCIASGHCLQATATEWHGVKLERDFSGKLWMHASILRSKILVTHGFNFIKALFPVEACNDNSTSYETSTDFPMADGAFLDDMQQLEAVRLDLANSLELIVKRQNQTFWSRAFAYFDIETSPLSSASFDKESVLKKCKEEIDKFNKLPGVGSEIAKRVFDEKICLALYVIMGSGGIDVNENPNPENKSQVFAGENAHTLEPDPAFNEEDHWLSVKNITIRKTNAGLAQTRRRKRQNGEEEQDNDDNDEEEEVCTDSRFDIRDKWPLCREIISYTRTQSWCENGWAIATAAALTDRACIVRPSYTYSRGFKEYISRFVSVRDTMECAYPEPRPCTTGYPSIAWKYYFTDGTVNERCKPFYNCPGCVVKKPRKDWEKRCYNSCDNDLNEAGSLDLFPWHDRDDDKVYTTERTLGEWRRIKDYAGTAYKVSDYFTIYNENDNWEKIMMKELIANGTIVAVFDLYDDFYFTGKGKIYRVGKYANYLMRTAIRVIGFGKQECPSSGTHKYWIVADHHGAGLLDNGIVLFGKNQCGIESWEISWGNAYSPFEGDNDN